MDISFNKKTSQSSTKVTVRVAVGITNGVLTPYLTVRAFYNLVAFDTSPKHYNTADSFSHVYNRFVKKPENAEFIVDDQPHFGIGSKTKPLLNSKGLRKFALDHAYKFQFCPTNMKNLMDACLSEFACPDSIEKLPQHLRSRDLPNNISLLPLNELYQALVSGEVPDSSFILSADFRELQRVLDSMNTFYIMELVGNRFRAGQSRDLFLNRLLRHPSYKSDTFIRFYGIYLFGESDFVDSATLENDFFLKAPLILNINKSEIERCKATKDSSFRVEDKDQIRRMMELCLLNPRIQYNGLVEPFVNEKALKLLNTKKLPIRVTGKWAYNNNLNNDATFP